MRKNLLTVLTVFMLAFFAVVVFAQEVVPTMPVGENLPQQAVIGVFAVLLPLLTNLIRKKLPSLPRVAVWSIPPVLGLAIGWALSLVPASGVSGWKGLAGGLIAIALHELRTTVTQHGTK